LRRTPGDRMGEHQKYAGGLQVWPRGMRNAAGTHKRVGRAHATSIQPKPSHAPPHPAQSNRPPTPGPPPVPPPPGGEAGRRVLPMGLLAGPKARLVTVPTPAKREANAPSSHSCGTPPTYTDVDGSPPGAWLNNNRPPLGGGVVQPLAAKKAVGWTARAGGLAPPILPPIDVGRGKGVGERRRVGRRLCAGVESSPRGLRPEDRPRWPPGAPPLPPDQGESSHTMCSHSHLSANSYRHCPPSVLKSFPSNSLCAELPPWWR